MALERFQLSSRSISQHRDGAIASRAMASTPRNSLTICQNVCVCVFLFYFFFSIQSVDPLIFVEPDTFFVYVSHLLSRVLYTVLYLFAISVHLYPQSISSETP